MIPTLLLAGLVFGRWWRISIPAATIGWAVLLVADGSVADLPHFLGAALLGFINVTIGVSVFLALRLVIRGVTGHHRQASPS